MDKSRKLPTSREEAEFQRKRMEAHWWEAITVGCNPYQGWFPHTKLEWEELRAWWEAGRVISRARRG